MTIFNLVREIRELKNQLSYSKKYGFFFGAGTSCALGVPNIATLTNAVELRNLALVEQDSNSEILIRFVRSDNDLACLSGK